MPWKEMKSCLSTAKKIVFCAPIPMTDIGYTKDNLKHLRIMNVMILLPKNYCLMIFPVPANLPVTTRMK